MGLNEDEENVYLVCSMSVRGVQYSTLYLNMPQLTVKKQVI